MAATLENSAPSIRHAGERFLRDIRAGVPPAEFFQPRPCTIRCAFCDYEYTGPAADAVLAGRAHRDEVHGAQIAAAAAERAAAARARDAARTEDAMQRHLHRRGAPDEPGQRAVAHGTQRAAERCKRANGEPCEVCRPFYEARLATKRGIAQRAKGVAVA